MTNQKQQQHPKITPPRELVREWIDEAHAQTYGERWIFIVEQAAQWGYGQRGKVNEAELQQAADKELEACCEWLETNGHWGLLVDLRLAHLRAARRPKPPTQAEKALNHFELFSATFDVSGGDSDLIRRALERLKQLENNND